jgi:hypothetical protein
MFLCCRQEALILLGGLTGELAIFQGSILQNSISAENFSDQFSSSKFGQFSIQNNI